MVGFLLDEVAFEKLMQYIFTLPAVELAAYVMHCILVLRPPEHIVLKHEPNAQVSC